MNRTILTVLGVFGASSLMLVDSAVKGTALLVLAAIAAMILRRDSAATRHLVWLLAIVAMLGLPVLSAMLPQWRVLPEWAGISAETTVVATSPPSMAGPAGGAIALPGNGDSGDVERPSSTAYQPAAAQADSQPALVLPEILPDPAVRSRNWINALPLLWAIGFSGLILRLMAARCLLWNSERQGTVIWSSSQRAKATQDPLITAVEAAYSQIGIRRPVTLLTHPDKMIPVVWGILRSRLLLPEAARHWSEEQLRSVLLHELAHIKRRDAMAQLLTQVACALHWFNPLVWFSAWRIGVERERACDDLVLASGVRPSAYAGHLLDVVTGLAPARWTPSCGLAMARRSSLEGRLVAVLSKNLNRRGVSMALAAIALAFAVGIAVPIAMLRAADERTGEKPKPAIIDMKPKHEYARALFTKWQAYARTDGKIPGALIGHLAREVDSFLKQFPQDGKAVKLSAMLPRLDASRDWTQADAVKLLDEITAISTAPVSWTDLPMEFDEMRNLKPGRPLPVELRTAAWGDPAANGLRAAWLLEPRAEQYAMGSVLKARVLFQNTGKAPVVFKTEAWHQYDSQTARDAKGVEIPVSGTRYTGITPTTIYRLAPGEYCEVMGHGVAIGAGKYEEESSTGSVGAVIAAKEGDDVNLSHSVEASYGGWTKANDPKDPAELWKRSIAERVGREAPLPSTAADREQLIRRVIRDVFGVATTAEEIAAFVSDNAPDALAKLTARLQAKPRIEPWSGQLPTGETRFRVTAADPDAAKKLRAANSPGRYVLADGVHLLVSQTTTESQRTNKAVIAFLSPDPRVASPHKPYEITLPDGIGTYGIVWERGSGVLWVAQDGLVRKHDFTNPAEVKETRFEEGRILDVPESLRDALRKVFEVPATPVQKQESQKSEVVVKLQPGMEERLKWGEPVDGLRAAVVIRHSTDKPKAGDKPDLYLVMQNVSNAPVRLSDANVPSNVNLRMLRLKVDGRTVMGLGAREPALGDRMLQPREVVFLPMFLAGSNVLDGPSTGQLMADEVLKDTHQSMAAELTIEKAPAGAWTGKLLTGDTSGSVAAGQPQPKYKEAKALYKMWQHNARRNGNIPGGFIGRLKEKVNEFIRVNSTDAAGAPFATKIKPLVPRFDPARDWTLAEAVALLDDIAAVSPAPIAAALDEARGVTLRRGSPLPKELANAPWGQPQANGLRVAFLLEPVAAEHRLGTPLKSRILFHNAGPNVVVFRTRTWHQVGHTARDAKGAEIQVDSTEWLTRGPLVPYRLWPGEFVEANAPGIGVGPMGNSEDWQNTNVGSWIGAKAGDDVTVTSNPVLLSDWNEHTPPKGDPRWWLDLITARLTRELPMPADAAERSHLVYRAGMDLFGTPLSAEEIAAFVSDRGPNALDSLAKRLARRDGLTPYSGSLTSGPTRFRVLPADPDAATRPRTANNPGRYTLSENAVLVVTRRPVGERLVNEASLQFLSADPNKPAPGKPHDIKLPDASDTWAAAWVRGSGVLWVLQKGTVRSLDFTNPAQVKETNLEEPANVGTVPQPILDVLRAALAVPGAPRQAPAAAPGPAATRREDAGAAAAAPKTSHRLSVVDASGAKPLREFRVIAGVRSSVSQEFEKARETRVAVWQSHTIQAGRDGVMLWPLDKSYDEMLLRVEADGCVPQVSDWIKKGDGPRNLTFKMANDPGVAGVAMLPSGRPAAGANVVLAMAMRDAVLEGEPGNLRHAGEAVPKTLRDRWDRPRSFTADENGRFILPTETDPTAAVLILHADAVRELPFVDFQKAPGVTLQPWGRLDGRVRWGDKPGTGESVDLIVHRDSYGYPGIVAQYAKTKSNAEGQFVFEKVLPGLVQISVPISVAEPKKDGANSVNLPGRLMHVTAKAGEPVPVLLGGRGRSVRGRLIGREAWDGVTFQLHPTAPHIGLSGDDTVWSAWTQFQKSKIGPLFFRSGLKVAADGSFEIPQVLPGDYQIFFSSGDGKEHVATGRFTVPAEDRDAAPDSQDAGEFRARQ